jgi:hypothetical protein
LRHFFIHIGEKQEIPIFQTSSIESDKDLQPTAHDSARIEYDLHSLSSLDDVTQPISYHPPIQTHRDQQHIAMVIKSTKNPLLH